ncbi:MAG: holin [Oscillospiraceae bacterium]|nr:holin [Oscillospiraceae bacterium]
MNKFNKSWLHAMLVRMLRTMAQTALGMISIGMAMSEVNWVQLVSVSVVAGLFSALTSISTSLPEVSSGETED